jgi:hypothetical protein
MKRYINKLFLVCVAAFALTSCLDEDPLFDPDKVENVIEFYDIGLIASPGSVYPLYAKTFPASDAVEMKIILSYSGAHDNNQDIQVKFKLDPQALETYNEEEGTNYEVLPSELYTMDAFEVTIPKGQRQVEKTITFNTLEFDLSKDFALPFTITETSHGIISGNFETAIFAVGAVNKYDGVYEVTGEFSDATNPDFSGIYPSEVELRTVNGNTVARWDVDLGSPQGYLFNTGSGDSYYGSFGANFILDDAGNVTSVVNAFGQPASNGRSAQLDPSGVNKFTIVSETDKTFEVSYYMIQPTGTIRCYFKEKFTFVRNRDL